MRHFFTVLSLCWLLGPGSALIAQVVHRPEADSLLRVLARSKADTNRVKVLLRLGEYQVYKPGEFKADLDSARTYAGQARALSRKLGHYPGEAQSLNLLGTVSRESRDFPRAIAFQQAAIRLSRRYKDVKAEAGSLLQLAHALRDRGDAGAARTLAQKALDLSVPGGHWQQAAEACVELGNTYAIHGGELDAKIKYYRQAQQTFAQAGNPRGQADVGKDLGDLYQLQGNHALALVELRKALALYESIHYRHLQGVYDLLGYASSHLGDYQEGLKYGLRAVRTAEAMGDSSMQLCTIYNRVGLTYHNLKKFGKAYVYLKKALLIAQKYDDRASVLLLTGNIASALHKSGQTEESLRFLLGMARKYPPRNAGDSSLLASRLLFRYTTLKQYATAGQYCRQLLAFAQRSGKDDIHLKDLYNSVIPFFLATKQYGQARKYLAGYEKLCEDTKYRRGASVAHLWWFQLDSMQANYPSAIRHYQRYKELQDSLLNETQSRQIANLEVLHETEQKEQNIQLKQQRINLLTKQSQLQDQQIQQDQLVRNAMIGGAVLLLLLLVLIYNRYRLKRRSNRLLQAQQRALQDQHRELQAQQDVLQAQQREINLKNEHLSQLLGEKDSLLGQKDTLIGEKEGLLCEKDALLEEQQRLLAEKERLLKEIHHRVKNNLQVVMSLLNSQAASLQDQAALSAIQESQHRVQSMALIHQKLYQSEGVARIPMRDYIEEVVAYLSDSYCLDHRVCFQVEVEDIELDVTQAVPLGLIINEAITNAFKYAFPGGRAGRVCLGLHRQAPARYALTISDNGVGLPPNYDPGQSRSLGMTLLHGFSGQLGGELVITSPPGLTIRLGFEEEQLSADYAPADYARA